MTDEPAQHDDLSARLLDWLQAGEKQPGGKLPLYDANGERIPKALIQVSLEYGLVEPWTPGVAALGICKLTPLGRRFLSAPIPQGAPSADSSDTQLEPSESISSKTEPGSSMDETDLVDWVRDDPAEEQWTSANWVPESWNEPPAEQASPAEHDLGITETGDIFAPEPMPHADESASARHNTIFDVGEDLRPGSRHPDSPRSDMLSSQDSDDPDSEVWDDEDSDLDAWDIALRGHTDTLDEPPELASSEPDDRRREDLEERDRLPPIDAPTARFSPRPTAAETIGSGRFRPGGADVRPLPADGMVLKNKRFDDTLPDALLDLRTQPDGRESITSRRTLRLLVLSAVVTAISVVLIFLFLLNLNRDGPQIAILAPEKLSPVEPVAETSTEPPTSLPGKDAQSDDNLTATTPFDTAPSPQHPAVTETPETETAEPSPTVELPGNTTSKKGFAGTKNSRFSAETLVIPFDPASRQIIERIVPPAAPTAPIPAVSSSSNSDGTTNSAPADVPETAALEAPQDQAPEPQQSAPTTQQALPGAGENVESESTSPRLAGSEPTGSSTAPSRINSDFLPDAVPLTRQSPDDAAPEEAFSPNPDPHLSERSSLRLADPKSDSGDPSPQTSAVLGPGPGSSVSLPLAKPAAPQASTAAFQTVSLPLPGRRSGLYRLQLLATGDRNDAELRKEQLISRYSDLFQDAPVFIEVVRRDAAPTLYRVKVGAFDSRDRAQTLCLALRERGQDCLLLTTPSR